MRYEHEFEERNFDRHRRDALASERLSSSASIVDIFSFCGNTGVYEFVSGGDINDAIWPLEDEKGNVTMSSNALSKMERLDIGKFGLNYLLLSPFCDNFPQFLLVVIVYFCSSSSSNRHHRHA